MYNAEKMIEMMNPAKAFEALSATKLFDPKAQTQALENAAEQLVEVLDLYQAQTRKVVDFWVAQNEAAVKEGKKFVKEWVKTVTKANADFVGEVETAVKDAAKVFELPAPKKAIKAA